MAEKKPGARVTLRDVAAEAGYSVNAVSRALRGMKDIGPQATERIREAAERLGYVGDPAARALRSGRSDTIALLVPTLTNPYFSVMSDLIQLEAQRRGFSLIVLCTREEADLALRCAAQAIARRVDRVLFFPVSGCRPALERLSEARVPCVQLASSVAPELSDSVIIDDDRGGRLAAEHLLSHGRRKLCFLSASGLNLSVAGRGAGFRNACVEAGLPEDRCGSVSMTDWYFTITDSAAWRARMTTELLALREAGFDGLFSFCDVEAFRIHNVLQDSSLFAPGCMGLIGFDDLGGWMNLMKPMCSIDSGEREIASLGTAALIERIEGSVEPFRTLRAPVRLTCRGSC